MELIAIRFPLIKEGDNVVNILLNAIKGEGFDIEERDIIAIADKIVATSEGRIVYFKEVKPSKRAEALAEKYMLEPQYVELVLREADEVFGGVPRAILTLKNDILIANAGIDHKNAPMEAVCFWSLDPNGASAKLRREIAQRTGKNVGIILVDSHVSPMRMGTTGFALGMAGFKPVKDCRGSLDLYGKSLIITRMNVADDLAAAAHLLMGETTERTPVVIIRGAHIDVGDGNDPREVIIPRDECLYMRVFLEGGRAREKKQKEKIK